MSKENKPDLESLTQTLREIQALATEALHEIADGARRPRKPEHKVGTRGNTPKSLPGHILKLRDSGYFKQSKTINEVHKKLKPTYDCKFDRVAMALLRLRRRKQLRAASKKFDNKEQVAYVW